MNRWIVRLVGVLLLLGFLLLFVHLRRQLERLQREQAPVTTTT
jgi:hypothetical protein